MIDILIFMFGSSDSTFAINPVPSSDSLTQTEVPADTSAKGTKRKERDEETNDANDTNESVVCCSMPAVALVMGKSYKKPRTSVPVVRVYIDSTENLVYAISQVFKGHPHCEEACMFAEKTKMRSVDDIVKAAELPNAHERACGYRHKVIPYVRISETESMALNEHVQDMFILMSQTAGNDYVEFSQE